MSEPFDSPKSVLRWACEDFEEFRPQAVAFTREYQAPKYTEIDNVRGLVSHGHKLKVQPSDKLQKLAYRLIGDLRNVLDQSVHAASVLIGTNAPEQTNFPVAETGKGVLRRLETNKLCKGIPVSLYDVILSFHPYWTSPEEPDGDNLLRWLLESANPNKHRKPLQVGADLGALRVTRISGPVHIQPRMIGDDKLEVFTSPIGADFHFDADIEFALMIASGRFRMIALLAFDRLIAKVAEILKTLEREARRISA